MIIRSHISDGARISTQIGENFVIEADQPAPFGDDSAPSPFDIFLSGASACAAYFAQRYCRKWKLPHDGISVDIIPTYNDKHALVDVILKINIPDAFPSEHREGLLKNAGLCPVKNALESPLTISLTIAAQEGKKA